MEQTLLRLRRRQHLDAHVHRAVFRIQRRKVFFQVSANDRPMTGTRIKLRLHRVRSQAASWRIH